MDMENIFLTGATGFLGAFLLHELLVATEAKVHCLVRAGSIGEGKRRIRSNLHAYSLWEAQWDARTIAVPGDLSRPRLGLTPEAFAVLSERIDAVYHNGATVNYVLPYAQLQAANVGGTQEILRLAGCGRHRPVYYVSTLRLFDSRRGGEPIREGDAVDQSQAIHSGYSQSKWVAEKLIRSAGSRGLPFIIFRPGLISGDSRTGLSNVTDAVCRMIKGCIQLGSVPDMEMLIYLTPVDFVVRSLVHLSLQEASSGETFHLVTSTPTTWNQIVEALLAQGYPLRRLPYERWLRELRKAARTGSAEALTPLLHYFSSEMPENSVNRRFDSSYTLQRLETAGITCPRIDGALLRTYLGVLSRVGFIESPPVGREKVNPAVAAAARTATAPRLAAWFRKLLLFLKGKYRRLHAILAYK